MMEPSVEEPLSTGVKRSNVIILVGFLFALLCATSWHVITIDKMQEEEELLHAGVLKKVESSNNNTHNAATTTAVVSEPPLAAKDTWPEISNRLCPDMKPKFQLARTIFRLARQELIKGAAYNTSISFNNTFSDKESVASFQHNFEDCNGMQDRLPLTFFSFAPAYGAHSRAKDGSNSKSQGAMVTYFPMWKCANNQLRGFWEHVFGKPKQTWRQQQRTKVEECTVMAVRDPISHFLSGYNEIETRIVKFSSKRESVAEAWPFSRFQAGSSERFQQLITDLLDCPMDRHYKGLNDPYPATLEFQHLYSMTGVLKLLASDAGRINMTRDLHYLPSLEDLEHTWPRFMVESCPGSFSNASATRILTTDMNMSRGTHESSKDLLGTYAAAKRVWSEGGVFAKALCALHILDYACWQDLPEGVPKLCLDLYVAYSIDNQF